MTKAKKGGKASKGAEGSRASLATSAVTEGSGSCLRRSTACGAAGTTGRTALRPAAEAKHDASVENWSRLRMRACHAPG